MDILESNYNKDGIPGKMGGHDNGVLGLSISFLALLNDTPREYVCPSRGLKKGDPLIPYLFLICT